MSRLENVFSGKHDAPHRVVLHGERGLGKSTFASEAPNPIFFFGEDGQGDLDISVMPTSEGRRVFTDWGDLLAALRDLYQAPGEFKTVVIDTIDSLWPALFRHVVATYPAQKGKAKNIEDYGYGKGFQYADDELAKFLDALDRIVADKGLNVILVAHSSVENVDPPDKEPWAQYRITGNKRLANRVADWASCLLFMQNEVHVIKKQTGKNRADSRGQRVIKATMHPAYWAKNRHGLPDEFPMPEGKAWATFVGEIAKARKAKAKEVSQ